MARIIKAGGAAVVTGAALGIGRAAARRLAAEGMSVVLVDIDRDRLVALADELAAAHGEEHVLRVVADLAEPADVAGMVHATLARFGAPTFLMNNAVTRAGRGWDAPLPEWRRAFETNFWGVVETCAAFRPVMEKAARPAAIVNVGSKQGITNPPGHPIYNVAKSALKTYSEALAHELRGGEAPLSVHLLVPGWTTTGEAEHKPGAWLPEQVVEMMVAAVEANDFYIICPDDETTPEMDRKRILWGAGDIVENRPPLSRWHPDWKEAAAKACS
ncbi:MAG: SDR family NAD(P)-dependent oxidoreductase [Pseudomonadota bacterium]